MAGWFPLFVQAVAGLPSSKRSGINLSGPDTYSYAFIDHTKQADSWFGPAGNSFTGLPYSNYVDSNGWANSSTASGKAMGGGIRIPGTDAFPGPYVLTWDGDGTVGIGFSGISGLTWTANTSTPSGNTTGTYSRAGNSFTNTSGQKARVILNVSGMPGPIGPPNLTLTVTATGGSGGFLKNLQFYRYEDEADLLAGKIFRTAFKQAYLANNPHHVRFLDWTSTNDNIICRWEHRNLPTYASFFQNFGANGQPKYGTTTNSNANYSLASATGMPVSMQHGELVTCRINATVTGAGQIGITAIDKTTGIVTAPSHGFSTGDVIIHHMWDGTPGGAPQGMTQLNNVPCTITRIDANNYNVNISLSSFSNFTVGVAYKQVMLNVGGRGSYPVMCDDGTSPVLRFGAGLITADNQMTFYFDKLLVASTTVNGAWVCRANAASPLNDGVPIEVCVALVNELMAMSPKNPIDMWVNVPTRGIVSTDPDYTSGSHYANNMMDVILNPSSTVRASGYSALDSRCNVYIEHSNETWNNGTFFHAVWLQQVGYQTQGLSALGNDLSTYATIRSKQMVADVKAALPSYTSRMKFVMGMFTTLSASDGRNQVRTRGNSSTGTSPAPLASYDAIAIAGYFQNNDSTPANSSSTCSASYFANIGNSTAQDAAMASYAAGFAQQSLGGSETIDRYVSLLSGYAAEAAVLSKSVIGYEGGIEPPYTLTKQDLRGNFNGTTAITGIDNNAIVPTGYYVVGTGIPNWTTVSASSAGSITLNAATSNSGVGYFMAMSPADYFTLQFKRSSAWATTYLTWYNAWNSVSNAIGPPEFILFWVNYGRWSHTFNKDSYIGTVEGAGFDPAWTAMSSRNNS